jgi:archaellum component FlaC
MSDQWFKDSLGYYNEKEADDERSEEVAAFNETILRQIDMLKDKIEHHEKVVGNCLDQIEELKNDLIKN